MYQFFPYIAAVRECLQPNAFFISLETKNIVFPLASAGQHRKIILSCLDWHQTTTGRVQCGALSPAPLTTPVFPFFTSHVSGHIRPS